MILTLWDVLSLKSQPNLHGTVNRDDMQLRGVIWLLGTDTCL